MRNVVAAIVTLLGLLLIGSLWMRELGGPALLDALLGSVYLFVGIGLFGHSRFTLFLAMGISAAHLSSVYNIGIFEQTLVLARIVLDVVIFLACFGLLFTRSEA